jgi:hypothetical protein
MKKKISQTRKRGKPSLVPTVEKGSAYVKCICCSVAFCKATHGMPGLEEPWSLFTQTVSKNLLVTAAHSKTYFVFCNRLRQNFRSSVQLKLGLRVILLHVLLMSTAHN